MSRRYEAHLLVFDPRYGKPDRELWTPDDRVKPQNDAQAVDSFHEYVTFLTKLGTIIYSAVLFAVEESQKYRVVISWQWPQPEALEQENQYEHAYQPRNRHRSQRIA